jgi:hypothetical protein
MHRTTQLRFALVLSALVPLCVLAGCSGGSKNPATGPQADLGKVAVLVTNIGDYAKSLSMLKKLFVDDNKLTEEDRKKYYDASIIRDKPPRIENDTAIIPVKIKDASGNIIAEREWTAVKVGEEWKLKSAPLK